MNAREKRVDHFFRERGRLTPKINTTFFIANWVPDILLFNKFFEKKKLFSEKYCKKPFVEGHDCFEGKEPSDKKDQYKVFCRK